MLSSNAEIPERLWGISEGITKKERQIAEANTID
jgi:hypothetical protein